MEKNHIYNATIKWIGNKGIGTSSYNSYERDHIVEIEKKVSIFCSSDPSFLGDASKHNPEELLVASLSACHMLWYLHLSSIAGLIIISYVDKARGIMVEQIDGSGKFKQVTLNTTDIISKNSSQSKATELHKSANKMCFIAKSVNS
jgi:organic hydroperoxide reductase OsmC/OhrA